MTYNASIGMLNTTHSPPANCHCFANVNVLYTNTVELALVAYTVSQKNCAKWVLSELRQISTNFGEFWQNDGKTTKIMRGALIFHLT